MRKIPTLFVRDKKNMSRVTDEVHPDCLWVFAGEGKATRKWDGTCCMIRDGKLYARREVKPGKPDPDGFELVEVREDNGKRLGWIPVTDAPEFKYHREAWRLAISYENGTYELVGPKIQGGVEVFKTHLLLRHGTFFPEELPVKRSYEGIYTFLSENPIEGIVFHHDDGRMAKIKRRDFGLPWSVRDLEERPNER